MKRILVALALGVGIAGCATFFAIRRFNEGPMQLARGGVTMRVVETEERAPRRLGLVAARGDVLIESDALRVVIAGGGRPDAPLGAVLEASLANGEGLARGATLLPVLTDGTREYPIVFEAFRIVERGDAGERVALHLTGAAQVHEQPVRVTVEYRLSDDRYALLIGTQLVPDPKWPIARGTLRQGFKRGPPGTANGPRRARQSLAGAGTLGFLGARTQRCIADLLSVTCRPVAHGWPT